jgi:glutaredoxin
MTRRLFALVLLALALLAVGCRRHATETQAGDAPPASLVVKDSSEGLLLTWIDEKGNFHVEQKVADVPIIGRDAVRVVDPAEDDGTHPDRIFVADLRTARADGAYTVQVSTRAEFESLAEARRQKVGPTLASASPSIPSAAPSAFAGSGPPPADKDMPDPTNRLAVIIYGASWCGACHQAAAYLRKKGVAFVEKDIEEDATAAREMRVKLSRAGLHGGSIPVLDVRGHVMIGFDPQRIDAALGEPI